MSTKQRVACVMVAIAVLVLAWSATTAEEPKTPPPGTQEAQNLMFQDDIYIKPGGGHPLIATLEWRTLTGQIQPGEPGFLGDDLLLYLETLSASLKENGTPEDVDAVRFSLPGNVTYTVERTKKGFSWKAVPARRALTACKHMVDCVNDYGIPPELMVGVSMEARFSPHGKFEPIEELHMKGRVSR